MRISIFTTILSIFFLPVVPLTQKIGKLPTTAPQHVVVEFEENGDLYYPFEMVKGSSIYSLSKAFNLSPEKIYQYNRIKSSENIRTGSILKIPLSRKKIKAAPPQRQKFVVLTYIVKPGETLYHLAKRRMGMEVKDLQTMNGLTDQQLRQGGEIILGWYALGNEADMKHDIQNSPVLVKKDVQKENEDKISGSNPEAEEEKIVQRRVIGFWDKSGSSVRGLYVLSNLAKPGSKIDLFFPMKNTRVTATVLGKIPNATYPEDINIILSPDTAKELGIIDRRFSIFTHYVAL